MVRLQVSIGIVQSRYGQNERRRIGVTQFCGALLLRARAHLAGSSPTELIAVPRQCVGRLLFSRSGSVACALGRYRYQLSCYADLVSYDTMPLRDFSSTSTQPWPSGAGANTRSYTAHPDGSSEMRRTVW